MRWRGQRLSVLVLCVLIGGLLLDSASAYAYLSGSVGYDVSYPQCTSPSSPVVAPSSAANVIYSVPRRSSTAGSVGGSPSVAASSVISWPATPRNRSAPLPKQQAWYSTVPSFGVIGVDSGRPFGNNPGNPCLASQYKAAHGPGLYVNTGFDPTYETTHPASPSCSAPPSLDSSHQAAWTVGCTAAKGDEAYWASQGIKAAAGYWLDVETANSWCGVNDNCDPSLNTSDLQGMVDTFTKDGDSPVGIYSTDYMWSAIDGQRMVSGVDADWYATVVTTAQAARTYCGQTHSFVGAGVGVSVTLVQFTGPIDLDYAC